MSVIVGPGPGTHSAAMTVALVRLLTLIALMLMPLGMTGAPAAASTPASHVMASLDHCDGRGDQDEAPASKVNCAAMCTALPATGEPCPVPALKPTGPRLIGAAAPFMSINLEIATPPPKLA